MFHVTRPTKFTSWKGQVALEMLMAPRYFCNVARIPASGVDLDPLIITLNMIGKFGITGSFATVFLYAPEIFPTTLRSVPPHPLPDNHPQVSATAPPPPETTSTRTLRPMSPLKLKDMNNLYSWKPH